MGVAHRDAFIDKLLVDWFPESLSPRQPTISRPRVYLNDSETAVRFDTSVPSDARTCVGLPLCASSALPERYVRPVPLEVPSGHPYDPSKLDVWQLGSGFSEFRITIPEIDEVLLSMTEKDPVKRDSAYDLLKKLSTVVHAVPPERPNIALVIV